VCFNDICNAAVGKPDIQDTLAFGNRPEDRPSGNVGGLYPRGEGRYRARYRAVRDRNDRAATFRVGFAVSDRDAL
jgi:hypothetical protein